MITTASRNESPSRRRVEMNGDDVEGIIWHTEGVQPLTAKEVAAEVKRLEQAAIDEAAAREAAKASGLAKLEAPG
jgi:hypothetical protein